MIELMRVLTDAHIGVIGCYFNLRRGPRSWSGKHHIVQSRPYLERVIIRGQERLLEADPGDHFQHKNGSCDRLRHPICNRVSYGKSFVGTVNLIYASKHFGSGVHS